MCVSVHSFALITHPYIMALYIHTHYIVYLKLIYICRSVTRTHTYTLAQRKLKHIIYDDVTHAISVISSADSEFHKPC